MTQRADIVRANVRAILSAASRRGRGWRTWAPVYPDTTNPVKAVAGRDPFGVAAPGAFSLWWSEFRTHRMGLEEVRCALWAPMRRQQIKAEAFNLITQSAAIAARRFAGA